MLGGGFYRPERAGKEVAEGGGPGGVRGFNGGHGGFGSVLACAASSYGAVMDVQACWNRAEGEAGRWRVTLFLLLSSGSHGRGPGMGDGKSTAESLGGS
jgi:hypothetical protein